jgi:hypothetical protein
MADEYDSFSNEYMDPYNPSDWSKTDAAGLVKGFWAAVKELTEQPLGIRKVFITGISPLSLTDNTSGFNIAYNMSFNSKVAGICGLTRADLVAALRMICDSEEKVEEHLKLLTKYANGYHFCNFRKVELMYNSDTCLEYLQVGHRSDSLLPPISSQFMLSVLIVICDWKRQS